MATAAVYRVFLAFKDNSQVRADSPNHKYQGILSSGPKDAGLTLYRQEGDKQSGGHLTLKTDAKSSRLTLSKVLSDENASAVDRLVVFAEHGGKENAGFAFFDSKGNPTQRHVVDRSGTKEK